MQQRYNFYFAMNNSRGLPLHPMRLFAFFMALVVLVLSILPCADSAFAISHGTAKVELSKAAQPQDSPQQDDCSPFCHCSCCASYSVVKLYSIQAAVPVFRSETESDYLPAGLIEVAIPIWQPPQLAS